MIPNDEMIELLMADVETLQKHITRSAEMKQDLRGRLHKALKKILLLEILLTLDVPRDRIVLSKANVLWLLRNIHINNPSSNALGRAISLLTEMAKDEDAN